VPPVHFITLQGESKITSTGMAAQGPAIDHQGKHMKNYFTNATAILQQLLGDMTEVALEDDPDWTNLPRLGRP